MLKEVMRKETVFSITDGVHTYILTKLCTQNYTFQRADSPWFTFAVSVFRCPTVLQNKLLKGWTTAPKKQRMIKIEN